MLIGFIFGVMLLLAMTSDTTVATDGGNRVHNLGLLQQQQQFFIISIVGVVFGAALFIVGWLKSDSK